MRRHFHIPGTLTIFHGLRFFIISKPRFVQRHRTDAAEQVPEHFVGRIIQCSVVRGFSRNVVTPVCENNRIVPNDIIGINDVLEKFFDQLIILQLAFSQSHHKLLLTILFFCGQWYI